MPLQDRNKRICQYFEARSYHTFFYYDQVWRIENRESKNNLSKRRILKTQWFNLGLIVLDSLASMAKQFHAYFMQKFNFKDKAVRKGFINDWKIEWNVKVHFETCKNENCCP